MSKRLAITVTEDHIARGIRSDGNSCPIALAFGEALGTTVTVDEDYIAIDHGATYRGEEIDPGSYRPTEEMACFVSDFDFDGDVVPVTFLLELVPQYGFGFDEAHPGEEALL